MDSPDPNTADDQKPETEVKFPAKTAPTPPIENPTEPDSGESPKGITLSAASPKASVANRRAFVVVLTVLLVALGIVAAGIYRKGQQNQTTKQAETTDVYPNTNKNSADSLVTALDETHKQTRHAGTTGAHDGTLLPPSLDTNADGSTPVPLVHRAAGAQQTAPPNYGQNQPAPPPTLSPEEQARQDAYDEEKQARRTPLAANATAASTTGQGLSYPGAAAPAGPNLGDLASALRGGGSPNSPAVTGPYAGYDQHNPTADYQGQNQQDDKRDFLKKAASRPEDDYLPHTRVAPIARFLLVAGTRIPATLDVQANSDLPGEITGRVREDVYDSRFGDRHLLIPQGSHLVGEYSSHITYGQARLQVAWDRLLYPDGSSIQLAGMNGEDATGGSGLKDRVNNHFGRLIGEAALTTAFAAGIALTQRQNTSLLAQPTIGNTISQAVGQQLGELGQETTRRNQNRQPTVQIRPGTHFFVFVNRDIAFPEPYTPLKRDDK